MQGILVGLIQFYRYLISPWLGQHCRFEPSCSAYALTAVKRFGAWRGTVLAVKRLSKCHPWHEGGLDPVPDKKPETPHG